MDNLPVDYFVNTLSIASTLNIDLLGGSGLLSYSDFL